MFAISSIVLIVVVSLCHGQSTNRQCKPDTIDFATKVDKSSVVVYGKPMAKIMNEGSDSVFHVFFQVDCVLKGPATLRQINITNAGRAEGKQYCQEFPVGRGYLIAFLEPTSLNKSDHKTFTPDDFVEILDEGNSTSQLLARTCNLNRLVPRQSVASVADVCPGVGTHPICLETINATTVMPTNFLLNSTTVMPTNFLLNSTNVILSDLTTNTSNKTILIPGSSAELTHTIHPSQQEHDVIKGKSGSIQVDVDRNNGSQSMTYSVLLMIMAILFYSN